MNKLSSIFRNRYVQLLIIWEYVQYLTYNRSEYLLRNWYCDLDTNTLQEWQSHIYPFYLRSIYPVTYSDLEVHLYCYIVPLVLAIFLYCWGDRSIVKKFINFIICILFCVFLYLLSYIH